MRVLKFTLSGELACFRKGTSVEGTTELILTYDLMPITVLKGIIGAVLGYSGLAKAYREKKHPEYLTKLEGVRFGIKPQRTGIKFTQSISNTTGFANGGVTNITKQELLSDVCYDIYIADDFEDFERLYNQLKFGKTSFPVVLGKKGLLASFSNVELLELTIQQEYTGKLESYIFEEYITEKKKGFLKSPIHYKFDIELPVDYNELMMYKTRHFVYSDQEIYYSGDVFSEMQIAILS